MTITPAPVVPAPESLRRRYGLLTAASGPLDLPAHGEGGGVRFVPIVCGQSVAYGVACYEPGEAPAKPLDGDAAEIDTGVFVALATLECGAVGYTLPEYRTKVRRRLESTEQASVEAALFSGLDFDGNSLDILSLDDEAVSAGSGYDPESIADVVGTLERYAYVTNQYGGVAYLHAPVEVAAIAAEAGLVKADGPRLATPLGSVWVFGDYPSGEIIVTGQVTIWRAPDISVHDAFDTTTNARLLIAERAYAVAFECFAGRATFSAPDAADVVTPTSITASTGADQAVADAAGFYRGFTLRETTGAAPATVVIYDNASAASGTILEEITLLAGESAREWYGVPGIPTLNGIYVDVVSGAVAGSIREG